MQFAQFRACRNFAAAHNFNTKLPPGLLPLIKARQGIVVSNSHCGKACCMGLAHKLGRGVRTVRSGGMRVQIDEFHTIFHGITIIPQNDNMGQVLNWKTLGDRLPPHD